MAQWLSWLERRPVTAEVESSSLFWVVCGVLAQLGEHLPYKQRVTGSSPVTPIFFVNYGGVAQVARACGSYPQCRGFKSLLRYFSFFGPLVKRSRRDPLTVESRVRLPYGSV